MTSNGWTKRPSLHTARSHPATAVYKERIYLFGGGGPGFKSLNSVEIFDPKENGWRSGADMPTLRSGAAAVTSGERIFVMGGGFKKQDGKFMFYNVTEIYYPETDSWERGPDMLQPHDYPAFAPLENEIYIIGGHHPKGTEGGPSTDPGFSFCEKLNLTRLQWEEVAPLNFPRFALSAGALNGKIVAFGGVASTPAGFREFDEIETYHPEKNQWTYDKAFSLPWHAAAHGGMTHQGRIYIFGGYGKEGIHTKGAFFNPEDKKWHSLPNLLEPQAAMTPVVIQNEIFLAGGWAKDGRTPVDSVSSLKLKK